jgi:hypothetical protein
MSSPVEPTTGKASTRRRAAAAAAVLIAGGAVTGGILASTLGASAASSPAPAASSSAGSGSSPSKPLTPGMPWNGPRRAPQLTGTVTAVGADTIGIKTSTATTTYSVTSATLIFKLPTATTATPNVTPPKAAIGKATLADVKVGDTVFFSTTTTGATVLARLFDGKLPAAGPRGFGPNDGVPPLTGTVTAVGTTTVDIKTSTGTVTYSVTSTTTVQKFATGSLDGVKVGDTVSFETTTVGGTVLAHLEDGLAGGLGRGDGPGGFGAPGRGGPGGFGGGGPGGMHGPNDGSSAAPSAAPAAQA